MAARSVVDFSSARLNQVAKLPSSGRRVSFAEWGEEGQSAAAVVLLLHGADAHRYHGCHYHSAAKERGVRIVAVDRPSRGLSEPLPHEKNRVTTVSRDLIEFMVQTLRVEKFGIIAQCFGCIYATAIYLTAPERVSSLSFVSPWVPASSPRMGRFLHFARKVPPGLVAAFLSATGFFVRWLVASDLGTYILSHSLSREEALTVTSPQGLTLLREIKSAKTRGEQSRGAINDSIAALELLSPFGFDYADLEKTLRPKEISLLQVIHGDCDSLVPLLAVQEAFSETKVRVVPGTHMLIYNPQVMADILDASLRKSI